MSSLKEFRSNPLIGLLIKTLVSSCLIVYLSSIIDFQKLLSLFVNSKNIYFFWSCFTIIFIDFLIISRLKFLIKPLRVDYNLLSLLKINLTSKFYALFLPSGIGYSIVRWYKVTKNKNERLNFAIVTIIEKIIFTIISAIFVGLPLIILQADKVIDLKLNIYATFPILIVGLLIALVFLVSSKINLSFFQRFRYINSNVFKGRWDLIYIAVLFTIIIQVLIVIRIVLLFYSVGLNISLLEMVLAGSFAFFVQTIPLSIAGIGLRELAFVLVLSVYGVESEFGVLIGSMFFAQMILVALIGGIIEFFSKFIRPRIYR
jgi:glycosyltransferase 2 family protein